jgi:transposase InsO family protein
VKVYPFIAAEKAAAGNVVRACSVLSVSRSAYYEWSRNTRTARTREDDQLAGLVERIHRESRGTYGAPRVHQKLRQDGIHTSRKRVARLMASRGLAGRFKRRSRRTTVADGSRTGADLLGRRFGPGQRRPDEAWVSDITYIRTWKGWAYLAVIIDLASRRVVGFAVADHLRTALVIEAMKMALLSRRPGPGLIFHSDRGSQYTSDAFQALLESHGIRQSLSRPRQCWDNAVAESFFSTLKQELIYRLPLATVEAARTAVFEYIEVFYNRQRLHSALGHQPPASYEVSKANTLAPSKTPAA